MTGGCESRCGAAFRVVLGYSIKNALNSVFTYDCRRSKVFGSVYDGYTWEELCHSLAKDAI